MPSNRKERLKAVRKAWEREKALVNEGKGTRDWTQDQQKSILDIGIALDEDGKAFEGQHMKSVKAYPEYADNPDNIQFLTRKEHLEAHEGKWANPTNWYYDPVTKQKNIFGEDELIPCEIINITYPIEIKTISSESEPQKNEQNQNEGIKKRDFIADSDEEVSESKTKQPDIGSRHEEQKLQNNILINSQQKDPSTSLQVKEFVKELPNKVLNIGKSAINWTIHNPEKVVGFVASLFYIAKEATSDVNNYKSTTNTNIDVQTNNSEPNPSFSREIAGSNTSKRPHDTSSYERVRFGKTEYVRGYSTGKNKKTE